MNLEELQIFLLLFADDGILFSQNPQTLQSMLNDVQLYCETWGLRLNVTKTKIMIFEKGRHTTYNFDINNQLIEIVSSFKYLGVYLYKNGNWYRTQKRASQHASYSLHNLFIGDLQTYQESKEYAIIVIVYKLNRSTISC